MALLLAALLAMGWSNPASAAAGDQDVSIGLLLIAVEARRDHLRVSEALRLSNSGPARTMELRFPLPAGAAYLTIHRGAGDPVRTAAGFTAAVRAPEGLAELAYSYALPAGRSASMARSFPLAVRRLEVVARGGGVQLRLDRGRAATPVSVGAEMLARWEVSGLAPHTTVTVHLAALPVSRSHLPLWGAGVLAVVLGADLLRRLRRPRRSGEETSAT